MIPIDVARIFFKRVGRFNHHAGGEAENRNSEHIRGVAEEVT